MQHRSIGKLAASAALGLAALALSPPVNACGDVFCSRAQPVNQAAERILLADNGTAA